ncbi:hypothetical protein HU200_035489 [Digitaria exilis]|uniref:F-box domain-containing protein n=1 Tax=Digitaria exilis TaxID=1010633 RepID=A0A835BI48_9POAL|nr:hypothetical protein HU200_035489 [Digitaria exilis]
MEAADACEIERLPEELLSAAICLTTPGDARRAAAVSRAFRAAADCDVVWSRFLPGDLPPLAGDDDGQLSRAPPSNKARFLRLAGRPVVLADGRTVRLSPRRSKNESICYYPLITRSFSEAAELRTVCWLEIRGKIDSKMLSKNSTYSVYLVFKVAREAYGLEHPEQNTSVVLGGIKSARRVCLDGYDSDGEDRASEFYHSLPSGSLLRPKRRNRLEIPQNVLLPKERADGWKELELGMFHNDEGEDGEVCISLAETSSTLKIGLIVQGVEIRPKKQG